jgi:hypothetical protein
MFLREQGPRTAILTLAALASAAIGWSARAQPPPKPDFARDQPWLDRVQRWNGEWVAGGQDGFYVVDLASSALRRFRHPAVDTVLALAECPEAQLLYGTSGKRAKLLRVTEAGEAEEIPVPEAVQAHPEWWHLAVDRTRAVLCNGRGVFWLDVARREWTPVKLRKPLWLSRTDDDPAEVPPEAVVLAGARLFAAINQGEFGGGLFEADLQTGVVNLIGVEDATTGLAMDAGGRLWATWGLSHLDSCGGSLRVQESRRWRLVARCGDLKPEERFNWTLPDHAFNGIAAEGRRVFLVTYTLGVVELDGSRWRLRTPAWPKSLWADALAVEGDTAIVVSSNQGVVVWNLRTGKWKLLRGAPVRVPRKWPEGGG